MDEATYKCPWCEVVKPLRGLSCHAARTHNQPSSEVHRFVLYGGEVPFCRCGCGERVRWLQGSYGKYLRGHNGFSDAAREKAALVRAERCEEGLISSWNAGLTKVTDPRVAAMAIKITASADGMKISKALAARSDDEKRLHRERVSNSKKGTVPWNVGLTRKTSTSLAIVGEKNAVHARRRFGWKDKPELVVEAAHVRSDELHLLDYSMYEGKHSALLFECVECKTQLRRSLHVLRYSSRCPACAGTDSKPQLEIYEFVRTLSPDAILSDRRVIAPMELDVLVPSKQFAIEHNGLYHHSEIFKDRNYHLRKLAACQTKNVSLLNVYGDDWHFRRPIVESMIRHRLGVTPNRVVARNCVIREVSTNERRAFLDANHLDGDVAAITSFGLEANNELVAVLSLRKPFHKKWKQYIEVARFATLLNTMVVGGLSKLTAHVMNWAKSRGRVGILSYVDGRVGSGSGYISSGYSFKSFTPPMFWWTDYERRFNRFTYRADRTRSLSEKEIAKEAGVVRIYGCSNAVMTIDF